MFSSPQMTIYWFVVRFCMEHDAAPSVEEIDAGLEAARARNPIYAAHHPAIARDEIIAALWVLERNGKIYPAANTARKLSHADEDTLRMVIDTRDDSAAEAK